MNKIVKILLLTLLMVIYGSTLVFATEYEINVQWDITGGKNISNVVSSAATTLTITAGEITDDDLIWIVKNLSSLEELNITGAATFTLDSVDGEDVMQFPDDVFNGASYAGNVMDRLRVVTIDIDASEGIYLGNTNFYTCPELESITITSLEEILESTCIANCRKLRSIDFPNLKKIVGGGNFNDLDVLPSLTLNSLITASGNGLFNNLESMTTVTMENARTFGDSAFRSSELLTTVNLPEAETFGDYAFSECRVLERIELPKTISFEDNAFMESVLLNSVTLENVTSFGRSAFGWCTSLESISLPKVKTFDSYAFDTCTDLIILELPLLESTGAFFLKNCNNKVTVTLGETIPSMSVSSGNPDAYDIEGLGAEIDVPNPRVYQAINDGNTIDEFWYKWKILGFTTNLQPLVVNEIHDVSNGTVGTEISIVISGVFDDDDGENGGKLTYTMSKGAVVKEVDDFYYYRYTPVTDDIDTTFTVVLTATDESGLFATDSFTISGIVAVAPVNSAPTIKNPLSDLTDIAVGTEITIDLTSVFEDSNGFDTLNFKASSSSSGNLFNTTTSDYSYTTKVVELGETVSISIRATDDHGEMLVETFTIEVTKADITGPILSAVSINGGEEVLEFTSTQNESGTLYVLAVQGDTTGINYDEMINDGVQYGRIAHESVSASISTEAGTYTVFFVAEDASGNLSTSTYFNNVLVTTPVADITGPLLSDVISTAVHGGINFTTNQNETGTLYVFTIQGDTSGVTYDMIQTQGKEYSRIANDRISDKIYLNAGTYSIYFLAKDAAGNLSSSHYSNNLVVPENLKITVEARNISSYGASDGRILITPNGGQVCEYKMLNRWGDANIFEGLSTGVYDVWAREKSDPDNISEKISIILTQPSKPKKKNRDRDKDKDKDKESPVVVADDLDTLTEDTSNPNMATITEEDIKKAKKNTSGRKEIPLKVELSNKGEAIVKIPSSFKDDKVLLSMKSDVVKVTVTSEMFSREDKTIELVIQQKKADSLKLSDEDKERIGNLPIFDIAIKRDGEKIHFNTDEGIKIEFELKNDNRAHHKFVAIYIDEDGTVEILKESFYDGEIVKFTTKHLSDYGLMYVDKSFEDCSNHWGMQAIETFAARDIINGISDGRFSPNQLTSRAEFVTIICRYFDLTSDSTMTYSDVKADQWYAQNIATAKELKLLPITYDELFEPNKAITREEMMYILHQALIVKGQENILVSEDRIMDSFTDKEGISDYAVDSVDYLTSRKIIQGANNQIKAKETTTRAEVAQMLYNLLKKMNGSAS